jgi:hypothetical protein
MSGNRDEESSCNAGVDTKPSKYQPVTSTSIHGRNTAGNNGGYSYSNTEKSTFGQDIPHDSENSSDFDVWVAPTFSGRYNLSFYNTCMVFLSGNESLHDLFLSFVYICIDVGDSVQDEGLEYPRHIFVPVRNWISNDTCHCFFCVQ